MTDGTLDTTFCGDGMVERSFERVSTPDAAMGIQSDGRIVLAVMGVRISFAG